MSNYFRRVLTIVFLGSIALTFAGCGKKVVGNTYKSGNGQMSVTFSSDTKADVMKNKQEIDDCSWTREGDAITVKTRVFGDMVFNVQSDGNLKCGAIALTLKE